MAHSPDHYDHVTEDGVTRVTVTYRHETVHACPPSGAAVMPCCGLTPFEVPPTHRLTATETVTCRGPERTAPTAQEEQR